MDLLIGEACALAEAVSLAGSKTWPCVIFESDSLILCNEVLSQEGRSCWAIESQVDAWFSGLEGSGGATSL